MDHAVARLDWGRWLADCPNPGCANAMLVEQGTDWWCRFPLDRFETTFGGCGTQAPVDWPDDPAGIEAAVAGLPEAQREWRPAPAEDAEVGA